MEKWEHRSQRSASEGSQYPRIHTRVFARRAIGASGALMVLGLSSLAAAADYHVGNGKEYSRISDVPLSSLKPGDNVFIHYKSQPYREQFGVRVAGSSWEKPIRISGVPGPNGELPVIDGRDAARGPDMHPRGLITTRSGAEYVVIENLELRGANTSNGYAKAASGAYAEGGSHLLFHNITFTDNGNGFFSNADSSDVIVRGCRIYGNGNVGSGYEHNSYTESDGITFEYNQYGKLRPGALGNNLKDRSAHMVVRYNWIEGGNRTLDLVESQEGLRKFGKATQDEPHYVYGNVLIKVDDDPTNDQVVHFGGEGSGDERRVMYFYNNTLVSVRPKTNMLWINGNNPRIDIRNNVFHTFQSANSMRLFDTSTVENGQITFVNNFVTQGYNAQFTPRGVSESGTIRAGSPGFSNDGRFIPAGDSPLVGGAAALLADVSAYPIEFEYAGDEAGRARSGVKTIGAFEVCTRNCGGATPPEPPVTPPVDPGSSDEGDDATTEPEQPTGTGDAETETGDATGPATGETTAPSDSSEGSDAGGVSADAGAEDSTDGSETPGDSGASPSDETSSPEASTDPPPAVGPGGPMKPPMFPGPDGQHGSCSVAGVGAGSAWPMLAWLLPLGMGLLRRRRR